MQHGYSQASLEYLQRSFCLLDGHLCLYLLHTSTCSVTQNHFWQRAAVEGPHDALQPNNCLEKKLIALI